jgi:hypothetical protein
MQQHIVARSMRWFIALALATLLCGSAVRAQQLDQILRGYEIAANQGISLNLKGKDWALVGLGSYLVNTTGCNDCHTHSNYTMTGNPYNGLPEQINTAEYMAGGRQFGPDPVDGHTVYSANITPDGPDGKGKPAGLTLAQFLQVIRTGHDPYPDYPGRLLQVMPWPLYQWKTDLELTAMYEYLRAIPPLPYNPHPGP